MNLTAASQSSSKILKRSSSSMLDAECAVLDSALGWTEEEEQSIGFGGRVLRENVWKLKFQNAEGNGNCDEKE